MYAEDILTLNAANRDLSDSPGKVKLYGIAMPKGISEIERMETSREKIFNSVRQGFAAAYDSLVLDPNERVRHMR